MHTPTAPTETLTLPDLVGWMILTRRELINSLLHIIDPLQALTRQLLPEGGFLLRTGTIKLPFRELAMP